MRKSKTKIILLITLTLLSSSIFSNVYSKDSRQDNNSIVITLKSNSYSVKTLENGFSEILMDDFGYDITPGKPKLPAKTFFIGLPPDAKVSQISIVEDDKISIPGEYKIVKVPGFVSFDGKTVVKELDSITSLKTNVKSSDKNVFRYLGMGKIRGYSYARIRFYPFTYKNNRLTLHTRVTIKIYYTKQNKTVAFDSLMDDELSRVIYNYNEIKSFYTYKPRNISELSPHYDYVIITSDNLVDALSDFKNYKEGLGYSVKIVTTSWIYENYKDNGEDKAKAIRDFLQDKYLYNNGWGIEYVLLVGSKKTIPMRYCNPLSDNTDLRTPTDMYYADLSGGWDSDGDGLYGECWDDDPHFTAEVYVGRIPFDNANMVKSICDKIKDFEEDGGEWKERALLLGAILAYDNENNDSGYLKTDGAVLMERCKNNLFKKAGYSVKTMYEKDGLSPSDYSCDKPLTKSNVIKEWKKGYGIVNWQAHGKNTSALRKVWLQDDGNGVPEEFEMEYKQFISSEDTSDLNNGMPSIVYACSCNNANPDDSSNLGYRLLKNGAVAFIGATGITFGIIDWRNKNDGGISSLDYYFFERFLGVYPRIGKAFYEAKVEYDWNFNPFPGHWAEYQNLYSFCLYGDPSLKRLKTENPKVEIIRPLNYLYIRNTQTVPTFIMPVVIGNWITAQAKITFKDRGARIENVMFCIDDEPIGWDCGDKEIYEYDLGRPMKGVHTIKVVASDSMGGRGVDEIKVLAFIT
ncbi:MAG TPA: hypothetical protein ENI36_00810 [Thermoplasmatales archaeon]|nr:hypothetical protein [Thermoplasmatales archaeon]